MSVLLPPPSKGGSGGGGDAGAHFFFRGGCMERDALNSPVLPFGQECVRRRGGRRKEGVIG